MQPQLANLLPLTPIDFPRATISKSQPARDRGTLAGKGTRVRVTVGPLTATLSAMKLLNSRRSSTASFSVVDLDEKLPSKGGANQDRIR